MLPLPLKVMIRPRMALLLLVLVSAPLGAQESAAASRLHALLVGVSGYDRPVGWEPLRGPTNDVELIETVLLLRGLPRQSIALLADREGADGRPTRKGIVGALKSIAAHAEPEDIVFIYLSGQGSQQPDYSGDELDGLDEIFLPSDVGGWDSESGSVTNAIVDDEISKFVSDISRKGAFVFLVVDSSYSGSSTRIRGGSVIERRRSISWERLVGPTEVGILARQRRAQPAEEQEMRVPRTRVTGSPDPFGFSIFDAYGTGTPGFGGVAIFSAAQPYEEALEMPLPPGVSEVGQNWYGLFTFHLARALAAHPHVTYRQAYEQVLQRYRAGGASRRHR